MEYCSSVTWKGSLLFDKREMIFHLLLFSVAASRREAEERARLEAEMARLEAEKLMRMTEEQKRQLEIRMALKGAIVARDVAELKMRTRDFKRNKLKDTDGDLVRAEHLTRALEIEKELGMKTVRVKNVERFFFRIQHASP